MFERDEYDKPNFFRTLTDLNHSVFKYGLQLNNHISEFEDPTYLGFSIEIDMVESPLFRDVENFLNINAAKKYAGMESRKKIHAEFKQIVQRIFNGQDSAMDEIQKNNYVKQHYINSITGLETLTKKFIDWKEDKITFELHEDISLYTSYLSQLYNNLVYSYENGRVMIPDNLCKFNMYIKISEIRNLTSLKGLIPSKSLFDIDKDEALNKKISEALKYNVSSITYKLHDCEFDFFGSKPFDDTITQSGIDGNMPTFSIVNMDLYFKSVSRSIYNPLIENSIPMNDLSPNLSIETLSDDNSTIKINNGFNNNTKRPSSIESYENEVNDNIYPAFSEPSKNDLSNYSQSIENIQNENKKNAELIVDDTFDPVLGRNVSLNEFDPAKKISAFGNNLKSRTSSILNNTLQKQKNRLNGIIEAKRKEIINSITDSVSKKLGLSRSSIKGQNVYTNNQKNGVLNTLGSAVVNDIKNMLL